MLGCMASPTKRTLSAVVQRRRRCTAVITSCCNQSVFMTEGAIREQGSPDDVLLRSKSEALQALNRHRFCETNQ